MSPILWFILIGLVAGWLAGTLVKGSGFGVLGDIVVGVIGAVIGGSVFHSISMSNEGGFLGSLVVATIGAVALLLVLRQLKKA